MDITPTLVARRVTPSESSEAVLHGQRALTPILSGTIFGVTWLYELHWCPQRAKSEGGRLRKFLDPPIVKGPFVLPPDLAVIKGQAQQEQNIVLDKWHEYKHKHENGRVEEKNGQKGEGEELKHAKTAPTTHKEERTLAEEL